MGSLLVLDRQSSIEALRYSVVRVTPAIASRDGGWPGSIHS
jgi:hypothetical protein